MLPREAPTLRIGRTKSMKKARPLHCASCRLGTHTVAERSAPVPRGRAGGALVSAPARLTCGGDGAARPPRQGAGRERLNPFRAAGLSRVMEGQMATVNVT